MTGRETALQWARRLAAIPGDGALRRLAAVRALSGSGPEEGALLLHTLVHEAHGGTGPARIALAAMMSALGEEAAELAEPLLAAARAAKLAEVEALFTSAAAIRERVESERGAPEPAQLGQSLGHLKWKARQTHNPDELARLALASEPSVVRNVLLNPRLTEETVVRLAARRPIHPEVLQEIWRSPRWGTRRTVRRALAFNPYLPPALGARIVPLLTRSDWRELAGDRGLQAEVRGQAERLLRGGSYPAAPLSSPPSLSLVRTDESEGVTSTRSSPLDARRKE